jgi:ketosteroid isomerase-like protein
MPGIAPWNRFLAQAMNPPNRQLRQQLQANGKTFSEVFEKNDAAAMAEFYTDDAVMVTDRGLLHGREAIKKHYQEMFEQGHFSNHINVADQYSPHGIGADDNEVWETGAWSLTVRSTDGDVSASLKGYWAAIKVRQGAIWKTRMEAWNLIPS